MATSTVPAAKAALLALLQARAGLSGVQITWEDPAELIQREAIYFGDTDVDERTAALGYQRRDESYDLELIVRVLQEGDDAQTTETRWWTIVAEIEQTLRATATSPSLSGTVLAAKVTRVQQRGFADAANRTCVGVVTVNCMARK